MTTSSKRSDTFHMSSIEESPYPPFYMRIVRVVVLVTVGIELPPNPRVKFAAGKPTAHELASGNDHRKRYNNGISDRS